ncbi:MAG: acyl--CoA ligase, partial [Bradyrhizobiaceae bacterium]|nr:acyl--CoA ligase [Bradyrhizobiaceae bacterium]
MTAASPFAVWWNDETLRDWVERADHEAPQHPAIASPAPLTYSVLHARTRALADFFQNLGLGRGDVIAAQLPNTVEFVLTYLASSYIGAILQTLHMPYRGAETEPLLLFSGAKAFVCVTAA